MLFPFLQNFMDSLFSFTLFQIIQDQLYIPKKMDCVTHRINIIISIMIEINNNYISKKHL